MLKSDSFNIQDLSRVPLSQQRFSALLNEAQEKVRNQMEKFREKLEWQEYCRQELGIPGEKPTKPAGTFSRVKPVPIRSAKVAVLPTNPDVRGGHENLSNVPRSRTAHQPYTVKNLRNYINEFYKALTLLDPYLSEKQTESKASKGLKGTDSDRSHIPEPRFIHYPLIVKERLPVSPIKYAPREKVPFKPKTPRQYEDILEISEISSSDELQDIKDINIQNKTYTKDEKEHPFITKVKDEAVQILTPEQPALLVSVSSSDLNEIRNYRKTYSEYLQEHGYVLTDLFDPWTILERISEDILKQTLQHTVGGIENILSEMIEGLLQQEFSTLTKYGAK